MAMDGCGNLMKYVFGFINLVILIGGGTLFGIGISALVGDGSQVDNLIGSGLYQGTAIILCVAGTIIVVISFLGCCGAFQESKCLLGTFFCLVLVMFILAAGGAIAAFMLGTDNFLDGIGDELKKSMDDYGSNDAVTNSWDWVQQHFKCCGVNGWTDWKPDATPSSCYPDEDPTHSGPFTGGCLQDIKDFIDSNSKLFGGITLGVVVFLLASMIFSCAIMKSIH